MSSTVLAFLSSKAIFLTKSLGRLRSTADLIHLSDKSSDGPALI